MSTRRKKGTGTTGLAMLQARSRTMLDDSQKTDIAIAFRSAYVGLTTGRGTEQLWHTLACALCIAEILADGGIDSVSTPVIYSAQEALCIAGKTSRATHTWFIRRDEFIINAGLSVLERQITEATTAQVSAALREVMAAVS